MMAMVDLGDGMVRVAILMAIGACCLAVHVYLLCKRNPRPVRGRRRSEAAKAADAQEAADTQDVQEDAPDAQDAQARIPPADARDAQVPLMPVSAQPSGGATFDYAVSRDASGEEIFERARVIPHQLVPDFDYDGPYLELLGRSAAKGYAPAMEKLGDYAARREAWVEAYYWLTLAQRNGMKNIDHLIRRVRKNWVMDGMPDEFENVHALFPPEAGSVGRALLGIASGRDAVAARAFLQECHPGFLFDAEGK